jgi:hypothetical protein
MPLAARAGARGSTHARDALTTPAAPAARLAGARVFTRRNLLASAGLFLAAFAVLAALQLRFGLPRAGASASPYLVDRAWSLLHGRWDLVMPPATVTDREVIHGNTSLYYATPPGAH